MQSDNIKLFFTYTLALIVVVGGGIMLYLTRLDPPESASQDYGLLVAGFIGMALSYVFNRETATATARQLERSYAQTQPNVSVTAGPPASASVTSPDPVDTGGSG